MTGSYWNVDDPLKPWGLFDPNSVIDVPFDWNDWLAAEGTSYASHTFSSMAGLEVASSTEDGGIITARVQADGETALKVGKKYSVTCRLTDSGGQVMDQTVWFKVAEL